MKTVELEFKNLNIGYYFLFDNKVYMKNTDHSAIQVYSDTEQPIFTNVNSAFFNVDSNFNYTRPSMTKVVFNPDDIIFFVKREDIKKYISEYLSNNRITVKFGDLKVGDYYKDEKGNYFRKISYYNSIPIYKEKIGLNDKENIVISTSSSGLCSLESVNKMYYNGNVLIDYDIKSWNIIWFDQNFTSYNYESFDTENNFDSESKKMIKYISEIPDNAIVFILNSKDSQLSKNVFGDDKSLFSFSKILIDNPESLETFESIGFTENVISNIGKNESILMVSKKNKEILYYKKINYPEEIKPLYMKREDISSSVIDYTYTFNQSTKSMKIGYYKENKLDDLVIKIHQNEINLNLLYNISTDDPMYSVITDNSNF